MGHTRAQVCEKLGIAEQTYSRWRHEDDGLSVDLTERLQELEGENTRLEKLVAEHVLDISILTKVATGNY
jgi:putative transposase